MAAYKMKNSIKSPISPQADHLQSIHKHFVKTCFQGTEEVFMLKGERNIILRWE